MKNKSYHFPIILLIIFIAVAISLWLTTGKVFYLFNFLYIGGIVSLGVTLLIKENKYSRLFVQLGVGLYMLIYLGMALGENMQIEGFFYYLFLGVFQGACIHYFVAKIAGPFIFGRGWCGYACWTAMVLDFLPYKIPTNPRIEKLGIIRYIMFFVSLVLVVILFALKVENLERIMALLFIAGNILYYFAGIALAIMLKDNRAFCKYVCPIAVFLKPASYFSLTRIKVDADKCIDCKKCIRTCPMNVDMLNPSRSRKNGTECILCLECSKVCPKKAIKA
jgi:ferredoxin